jgi:hypothetical protein
LLQIIKLFHQFCGPNSGGPLFFARAPVITYTHSRRIYRKEKTRYGQAQRVLNEKQIGKDRKGLFGQEANSETTVFDVIVTFTGTRVNYGSAEFLHQADVLVHAAFRHSDFVRQFGGCAGAFDADQMIDPIESLKDLFLHSDKVFGERNAIFMKGKKLPANNR